MIQPATAVAVPIDYPSGDGKPLAENDARRSAIMYGIGALGLHFRRRHDVYVSGDLLVHYGEGNPHVSVAPDVFVVFGVEKRKRLDYKLREEGRAPAFVLEVASRSTWREDIGPKRPVRPARRAGVPPRRGGSPPGRRSPRCGGGNPRAGTRSAPAGTLSLTPPPTPRRAGETRGRARPDARPATAPEGISS